MENFYGDKQLTTHNQSHLAEAYVGTPFRLRLPRPEKRSEKMTFENMHHQTFQVPKMEGFLNLIRLFWGWVSPYISRIHTAYIGFRIPPF